MELLIKALPWTVSFFTIIMLWLTGNKRIEGWIVGILCQVLWFMYIFSTKEWGLMPLNIASWFIVVRNAMKSKKEEEIKKSHIKLL